MVLVDYIGILLQVAIWMMSNDDPVFLSEFIEYLDNNCLSRKEKNII